MSNNPYGSPAQVGSPKSVGGAKPAAITWICVLAIVFGTFGLLGVCSNIFGILMIGVAENMLENMPAGAGADMEFQRQNLAASRTLMIPTAISTLFNLVVAAGLVSGGIGVLKMSERFRGILVLAFWGGVAYGVVKIGLAIYSTMVQTANMNRILDNPEFENAGPAMGVASTFAYAGLGVAVLFSLALMAFYVWGATYLNKPHIRKLFS